MSESTALLDRVRTEPRLHAAALVAALAVGVARAAVHWLGLTAAGALASLVAPTVRRGVAYGLGAGVVALATFGVSLGPSAAAVPGMRPIVSVAVGAGQALPLFGSLARAVVD